MKQRVRTPGHGRMQEASGQKEGLQPKTLSDFSISYYLLILVSPPGFHVACFSDGPPVRSRLFSRVLSERGREKSRERPGPSENQARFHAAVSSSRFIDCFARRSEKSDYS